MADTPRPGGADDGGAPLPMARSLTSAERERVIEHLTEAFAHDLVALDEFERRVDLAYRVTTPADLRALTADLMTPAPSAHPVPTGERTSRRIGAVMTNVERPGPQVIPERLEIRAFLSNVELDLSRSRLTAAVTEIDIRCILGNVELRLPPGVIVDNDGGGFLGSFECYDALGPGAPGAPTVRVIGRATLGAVMVTVAREPGGLVAPYLAP